MIPAPAAVSASASELAPSARPHASPAVRLYARELGVDLTRVSGSGRKGRITKEDVQGYVKQALAAPAAATRPAAAGGGLNLLPWPQVDFAKFGPVESQPLSRIKKISGANLARNWAMIPHVTQFDEADITEMEAFRKKLGEENKELKVTPLVLALRSIAAWVPVTGSFAALGVMPTCIRPLFVKDDSVSVEQHVAEVAKKLGAQITVVGYVRFEKGEGIEKRCDDLADEVNKLIK